MEQTASVTAGGQAITNAELIKALRDENERLRAKNECPTCAQRGYDNADYHRLHRAWCDSVAEVERLRAALKSIARNTCCDRCQEAALVAKAALAEPVASQTSSL
jgi:hypothetical protein